MKFVCGIIACIVFWGCKEYPEYPDIPQVEFESAMLAETESDKIIDFSFMLYDGNGDIGLAASDTSAPYIDSLQQNFHAKIFVKQNGIFIEKPYNFSYRIPLLRDKKSTKFIKANVTVTLTLAKPVFPYDTMYFTYFVYDRALNKSNVDTSEIIIFPN